MNERGRTITVAARPVRQNGFKTARLTLEGTSLTDTTRKAEDALALLGALIIKNGSIEGNDSEGWTVTLYAEGT